MILASETSAVAHAEMIRKMTIGLLDEYPNAAVAIAERQIDMSDAGSKPVWMAIRQRLIDLAARP